MRRGLAAAALLLAACAPAPTEVPSPPLDGVEAPVAEAFRADRQAVLDDPGDVARWARLGDRFRSQGMNREAALCYLECERLDPESFRWPYLAGKSLRLDAPAEAVTALRRAVALDAAYAPARLFLGQALVRTGDFASARLHFEEATRLDPGLAAPWLALGQLALSEGNAEVAMGYLQEALRRDAGDGRIYLAASQAAAALGLPDDAARYARFGAVALEPPEIPDPRAALEVEPVGSRQLAEHGRRLMAQRKLPEALAALRESVRLDGERAAPRVALGLALMIAGENEEAETHLRKAVWLSPNNVDARAALGNLLLGDESRRVEAREHLEEAVGLRPHDPELRVRLARALDLGGFPGEARAELVRARDDARDALEVTAAPEARQRLEALVGRLDRVLGGP